MSRINWNIIIETFFLGFFGTAALGAAGCLLFGLFQTPTIVLIAVGSVGFIYVVGWCLRNYKNFKDLLHLKREVIEQTQPEISYRIPVIGKLEAFEEKYHLSTVRFMVYIHDNNIPYGMNNLDYLEWLSLVNELPSINNRQGE